MKHRISVGGLVVHNDKALMVNHKIAGRYDFWVAPGGGVQGTESLEEAVIREVKEETGVNVQIKNLLYIEEMYNPQERSVKFWYHCEFINGLLDCSAEEAIAEHIIDVKFMDQDELRDNTVFPHMLLGDFWEKKNLKNSVPEFIELREMKFY